MSPFPSPNRASSSRCNAGSPPSLFRSRLPPAAEFPLGDSQGFWRCGKIGTDIQPLTGQFEYHVIDTGTHFPHAPFYAAGLADFDVAVLDGDGVRLRQLRIKSPARAH